MDQAEKMKWSESKRTWSCNIPDSFVWWVPWRLKLLLSCAFCFIGHFIRLHNLFFQYLNPDNIMLIILYRHCMWNTGRVMSCYIFHKFTALGHCVSVHESGSSNLNTYGTVQYNCCSTHFLAPRGFFGGASFNYFHEQISTCDSKATTAIIGAAIDKKLLNWAKIPFWGDNQRRVKYTMLLYITFSHPFKICHSRGMKWH